MATNIVEQLQTFSENQLQRLKSNARVQNLLAMPTGKRYLTMAGLFIASQIIVFGGLYLFFGEIVVIGFFASVVAGLATGLGALPALFFKTISDRLFNSLLGAAAGVMLAATAFSLLVPGMD